MKLRKAPQETPVPPDSCTLPVVLQAGMYGIIPQVLFRTVENVDIPENTGHAELVLILKVAAIAPLEYQHGNFILAGLYIALYQIRGHMGCLAVPDKCAVDPEIEAGIHSLEIQMLGKAFLSSSRVNLRIYKPQGLSWGT